MDPEHHRKMIEEQRRRDEEICSEKWAEGELDIMPISVGQFSEYMERIIKIQNLSISPYTVCRQVKLMREAIEIITAHERKNYRSSKSAR